MSARRYRAGEEQDAAGRDAQRQDRSHLSARLAIQRRVRHLRRQANETQSQATPGARLIRLKTRGAYTCCAPPADPFLV
jgi:hypothetical protein